MAKKAKIKNSKQNKKQETNSIVSGNEINNLIKIVLILCAILLLFYFITELVTSKDKNTYTENTTPTIQYDKVLVGQILNRKEKDYYVLVEKENDQYVGLYNYYLSSYDGEREELKYYRVDLSDVFNSNHIGEKNKVDGDVSEFTFAGTTLLRVKNGTIKEVYDNRESIVKYLENLK